MTEVGAFSDNRAPARSGSQDTAVSHRAAHGTLSVAPFVAIVALIPRALPLGRLTKLARARGEAATLLHATCHASCIYA